MFSEQPCKGRSSFHKTKKKIKGRCVGLPSFLQKGFEGLTGGRKQLIQLAGKWGEAGGSVFPFSLWGSIKAGSPEKDSFGNPAPRY